MTWKMMKMMKEIEKGFAQDELEYTDGSKTEY